MALVLRTVKGSPLTWQEGDNNLLFLSNSIVNAPASTPGGVDGEIQYNDNGTFNGVPDLTYLSGSLIATGSFNGILTGIATTASYVDLVGGPGITVNGLEITASVRTVNGSYPVNGNVTVALTATVLGTSASFDSSGSGAVTGSLQDGLVWIIANDPTTAWNGDVYIYSSGSVGQWYPVAPLDQAAGDARYIMLDGNNTPLTGDIDMGGYDLTNAGTFYGTASTASFVTGSNVWGPSGSNSILNASTASYINPLSQNIIATLSRPYGYVKLSGGNAFTSDPASYLQTSYGNLFISNNVKYESGSGGIGQYYTNPVNKPASSITLEPSVGQIIFYTYPQGTSGSLATGTTRLLVAPTGVVVGGGGVTNFTVTGSTYISGTLSTTDAITMASASVTGAVISNIGDTFTSTAAVTKIVSLTSAEYSGLGSTDANTLYVVI